MNPIPPPDVFQAVLGASRDEWLAMNLDRRAALSHEKIPDLAWFLDEGRGFAERDGRPASRRAAQALLEALAPHVEGAQARSLPHRILIDPYLLSEHDRDQNVYLGRFYTRVLTRAVPDLIFQPVDGFEIARALQWARGFGMPVTLRGAGTTAMGGAVPGAGGLLLDLSRLDAIGVHTRERVAMIGAGARLKQIHERLAAHGLALHNYPSNLGGTLAGWFATGGIGMNAFAHGECRDHVRTVEVVLPGGQYVRFHGDGRLDVLQPAGETPRHLSVAEGSGWLESHALSPLSMMDFAGTEGQFGVIVSLTVSVCERGELRPHLVPFAERAEALRFVNTLAQRAESRGEMPSNLKYLSLSHLRTAHAVWRQEGRGPADWNEAAGGYVYFDFPRADWEGAALADPSLSAEIGREMPATAATVLSDKFRPMQVKRLGPGLLASETLLDSPAVPGFLAAAEELSGRCRIPLDFEVYYLRGNRALAIASYLTDPARAGFFRELLLAPVLTELSVSRFGGRAYVLGRWSAAFHRSCFDPARRRELAALKRRVDPGGRLNGTIFFRARMRYADLPGRLFMATFRRGLGLTRALMQLGLFARVGAAAGAAPLHAAPPQEDAARAATCVNCGECNSVCPIFHEAKVRLPQMLTHMGERMKPGGADYGATEGTLLDLCMRCGNCAEVCQSAIPHLPIYQRMQQTPAVSRSYRRDRHEMLLGWIRTSAGYRYKFLKLRPGFYLRRTPASLPGGVRFVLRRAEPDAGPVDTCIHCGACVPVCPTGANFEFGAPNARVITTDQSRCVGCGTCVEVCPANLANGGRTLRVMEAPVPELIRILDQEAQADLPSDVRTGPA